MAAERPVAVLGATGYTGRLVVERARELALPLRLVGRRRDALERLTREGEEVRVADASDLEGLAAALEGASVVASLAGPFSEVGHGPVEAAVRAHVHYVDTSGEQSFSRDVYERFGERARERDVVLLTAFGFDFVPGDFAARIAAEEIEPVDEIAVGYSVARMAASRGTLRSVARVMAERHVAYDRGLVRSRFGATTRRLRFPNGEKPVVEWPGTEPLTVPRHTKVERVRSYYRTPRIAARAAAVSGLAVPLVHAAARVAPEPSAQRRAKTRFTVVAEARGERGARVATLAGHDVYALTALLVVRAAEALRAGEVTKRGALAPAEAFSPRTFLQRLDPLLRLHSVDPL
jgi:short subunit dehydrogenase-like uncharacterized protein